VLLSNGAPEVPLVVLGPCTFAAEHFDLPAEPTVEISRHLEVSFEPRKLGAKCYECLLLGGELPFQGRKACSATPLPESTDRKASLGRLCHGGRAHIRRRASVRTDRSLGFESTERVGDLAQLHLQ
jgi:hypothetical protein